MAQPAEHVFVVGLPDGIEAPAMEQAILDAGEAIRAQWEILAAGHEASGRYLAALQPDAGAIQYPYLGDSNVVAVVNTTPQAEWIEEGRSGFHLAERWGRGTGKWRQGKDGNRYAYVVFRHRTPIGPTGSSTSGRRRMEMPANIYALARQLEDGQRLKGNELVSYGRRRGDKAPLSETGLQSKSYNFYRQIFSEGAPSEDLGAGYTWKTPKYVGLTHRIEKTPEGGFQAMYSTVRTITPESNGWYIPPTPAHHYAQRALDAAAPVVQALLEAAAAADLAAAVLNATQSLN